jgi:hypothetical protein
MSGVFVLRAAPGKLIARGGIELPFPLLCRFSDAANGEAGHKLGGRRRKSVKAPSVTVWAHTVFPELRENRLYHHPGDDSRP